MPDPGPSFKRYVIFDRGGRRYAIPEATFLESASDIHITPVPLAGPLVVGVFVLHSHPVPVFDLAAPSQAKPTPGRRVVVLEVALPGQRRANRAAILVDHDLGIRVLDTGPMPAGSHPPFVIASGIDRGSAVPRPIACIDPFLLFDTVTRSVPGSEGEPRP